MSRTIEPYLRREIQEIALLAITLCQGEGAFPSDQESLQSLIQRINHRRAVGTAAPVVDKERVILEQAAGSPSVSLSLGDDASLELTAFDGAREVDVSAHLSAAGPISGLRSEGAVVDEDAETSAYDLLFNAARVVTVGLAGAPASMDELAALTESMAEVLGVRVTVVSGEGVIRGGEAMAVVVSGRSGSPSMVEVGPVFDEAVEVKAYAENRICSAWLTAAGRLEELATDQYVRIDAGGDPSAESRS